MGFPGPCVPRACLLLPGASARHLPSTPGPPQASRRPSPAPVLPVPCPSAAARGLLPPRLALPGRLWMAFPGPCVPRSALCSPRALSPCPSRGLLLLPSACSRVSTCPVVSPAVSSQEPGGSRSLFPPVRTHSDAALVSACPRQARLCFPGQRGPPPRLPPSVIASFLDSLLRLPVKVDVLCPLSLTPSW